MMLQDAAEIVDIVELWLTHGKEFMEWKNAPPPPTPIPQQQPSQEETATSADAAEPGYIHRVAKAAAISIALSIWLLIWLTRAFE